MGTKKTKNEELKIRLIDDLKGRYKKYCLEKGIDMSSHIRNFIEKTLETNASHKDV